jgi:DNA-directed RNA polymerase subunit RPC12/RpoP
MLICNRCGAKFDQPEYRKERVGEAYGGPYYERYEVCPECGSEDLEETEDESDEETEGE